MGLEMELDLYFILIIICELLRLVGEFCTLVFCTNACFYRFDLFPNLDEVCLLILMTIVCLIVFVSFVMALWATCGPLYCNLQVTIDLSNLATCIISTTSPKF